MKKVAVVTGGNRGLGFETCRQLAKKGYHVVLGARSFETAKAAAAKLTGEKLEVVPFKLDVTDQADIAKLKSYLMNEVKQLDVLINNAGVFLDGRDSKPTALDTDLSILKKTMETNVYGPFLIIQALAPLMAQKNSGRVINLSSGMGQLDSMNSGAPAYRISKTAVNAVTKLFSDEFKNKNVLVNSVCPGWVKTDMGGDGAELEISEGVDTIVWLATAAEAGETGKFYRKRKEIPW